MTHTTPAHVLDVHDLIDEPGASRPVRRRVPVPSGLDLPLAEVRDDVRIDGMLESVVEGILLRGEVGTDLTLACSRCLEPVLVDVSSPVTELYGDPARVDEDDEVEEGFELSGGQIDIDPLLRDVIAAAVPLQPRCRPDCAGLCPTCGVNRNCTRCECVTDDRDPRWSALQSLQLPTDPDDTGNN